MGQYLIVIDTYVGANMGWDKGLLGKISFHNMKNEATLGYESK